MKSTDRIGWFADVGLADRPTVGGKGASLGEIAHVLRHRCLDTTAIYAKVDRRALRALARRWPGGAS